MQFRLFVIPGTDSGESLDQLNKFLRSHRILEENHELVSNKNGSAWHFCIKYLEHNPNTNQSYYKKVDYKQILDEKTFEKFSILRTIRKEIAAEEAIPAYAVFTDKELAEISKLSEIDEKSIQSIKGIGKKKVEKYGSRFMNNLNEPSNKLQSENNEKSTFVD